MINRILLSLILCASLCSGATLQPIHDKIIGPNGSQISVSDGNATIQPSSGGAVNVVTGTVYVPTVLDFSTTVSPTVSGAGHASIAFNGTGMRISIGGANYIDLGGTPFNPAVPGPIGGTTPGTAAFTTLSASGNIIVSPTSKIGFPTPSDYSVVLISNTSATGTGAGLVSDINGVEILGFDGSVAGDANFSSRLNNAGTLNFYTRTGSNFVRRLSMGNDGGMVVGSGAAPAANTLALRNGGASNFLRVYETFTDSSNGRWIEIGGAGHTLKSNGTGGSTTFYIGNSTNAALTFLTNDTGRWSIDASGHFLAAGAYNVTTTGAGSFAALSASGAVTFTGTNLNALWTNQLATNSAFVSTSNRELLLINGASGSNVAAFQSNDTTGTSAIAFRDSSGNETGATGYGNSAATVPFRGRNYYQTWSGTTYPPDYIITADGDYGSVGSGFRFYPRVGVVWDNSNSVACFNIYHHDGGTTPAFQVINSGTAASFIRVSSKSNDCSIQWWKDASASKVFAIGNSMPGNAAGDDGVFATYNSGWSERLRISATTGDSTFTGANIICATAGKGLQLKSGTGARAGNATLVGGTVTIANTTVTANTICIPARKTPGGTLGQSLSYSISAGTSLTITSVDATGVLSALDTSVVSFLLLELN